MLSSASAGSGTRGLYTGSAALGSGDVRLTVVRVGPARIALILAVVKDRHTVGDDPPMPSVFLTRDWSIVRLWYR